MNAKELMIGDWVINTEGKEQIRDVVRKISPEFLGLRYSRRYVPIECIEPIPLTPELLVANGFKEEIVGHVTKNGISDFPLYSLNENIRLEYPEGQVLTIIGNDKNNIFINKNIQYVHQLQHAFRMLQYDNLADNFKVI